MPPENHPTSLAKRVTELNDRYRLHSAVSVLEHALVDPLIGRTALVSSFGFESVALLHMVSNVDRSTPILFPDTGLHSPETQAYRREICDLLRLKDVRMLRPDRNEVFLRDPDGILHLFDPEACRRLRKDEPLQAALQSFDALITGRKRYQRGSRRDLDYFEGESDGRIRINPLAYWSPRDLQDYIDTNDLPRHPLEIHSWPSADKLPHINVAGWREANHACH